MANLAHPQHHAASSRSSEQGLLSALTGWVDAIAPCPWPAAAGSSSLKASRRKRAPLYTREERARRDATPWTLVQGVLAPVQFLIFLVSLALVLHYLQTGEHYAWATASIVAKTIALYAIMITGSIWEKVVFGKWLFARAFFWEDVVSMLVIGLQTFYLFSLIFGWGTPEEQMYIAIAAYAAYVINAGQFLMKLRAARLEGEEARRLAMNGSSAHGHAA